MEGRLFEASVSSSFLDVESGFILSAILVILVGSLIYGDFRLSALSSYHEYNPSANYGGSDGQHWNYSMIDFGMTGRFKEPSCTPRVTISQIDALNTRFSLSASPPHFVPFQEDRGVGLWLWFSVCYGRNNMFDIGRHSFCPYRKSQNWPDG